MAWDSEQAREAGKKSSRKGIPNRLSVDSKRQLLETLDKMIQDMPDLLMRMPPSERVKATLQLMEFVEPKKSRVEAEHTHNIKQIKVKAPEPRGKVDAHRLSLPLPGTDSEEQD